MDNSYKWGEDSGCQSYASIEALAELIEKHRFLSCYALR
jgi:hypothetical protein